MDIQFYKPEEIVIEYNTTRIGTRDEGGVEVLDLRGQSLCHYYRGQIEDPDNFLFYSYSPLEIYKPGYGSDTVYVVTNNPETVNFMLAMINIGYGVEETVKLMLEEKMLTTIEYVDTSFEYYEV